MAMLWFLLMSFLLIALCNNDETVHPLTTFLKSQGLGGDYATWYTGMLQWNEVGIQKLAGLAPIIQTVDVLVIRE